MVILLKVKLKKTNFIIGKKASIYVDKIRYYNISILLIRILMLEFFPIVFIICMFEYLLSGLTNPKIPAKRTLSHKVLFYFFEKELVSMNPRQQKFVDEYCVDLNATQAAIRAGYNQKTASVIGNENLRKPYIKQAIEERLQKNVQKNDITVELVLGGIKEIAFKQNAKETDRLRALELLGKYLKMFTDKIETKVETNEPIKVVLDDKMKDWSK